MSELLMRLIDANGPSGHEHPVRAIIMTEIKDYVDEMFIDKMGNLIAHRKGKGMRIMLAAHMDEIGLMVKKIEENGFIHFSTIGGIEPISLVAQKVDILTAKGEVRGVISFDGLSGDDIIEELPEIDDLYVDTGLNRKQLEILGVQIGDYIVPTHTPTYLGSQKFIAGKAMDDRTGCYVLIKLLQNIAGKKMPLDMFFVFTVQEEIGLYGAQTSLYKIDPQWGIAVDTTTLEESDEEDKPKSGVGRGPILIIKDSEMIANICLIDWLKKAAAKKDIPLQYKVEEFGTTDASMIMMHKGGMPAAVLAIPVKNIHSTISICNTDDIHNAIVLLETLLSDPPKTCIL